MENLSKAENTNCGPAGSNGPAMPVTPHDTHGHLDDVADGALGSSSDAGSPVAPTDGDSIFGGPRGADSGDLSLKPMSGPVVPVNP